MKIQDGEMWIRFSWHRIGFSSGLFEYGYEILGSIKGGEFVD
jgi:hypothetical protein